MPSFWKQPRQVRWRGWLFQVHLWAGLILGLLFTVVGLTGSLVVYKKELERLMIPSLIHVSPQGERQSFAQMTDLVRRTYPRGTLENAFLYQEPGVSWSFRLGTPEGRVQVYVDPYRNKILGHDTYRDKFLQWVYDLHAELLGDHTGLVINGIGAFVLMAVSLSGLVVWWPGAGHWRFGFSYETRARWKRQNYDLHKVAGFWSCALLLLVAFTGAYYAFPQSYEKSIAWITGSPAKVASPKPPPGAGEFASLDLVLANALRQIPEGTATLFTYARRPGQVHSLRKMLAEDWRTTGDNVIYLDPISAQVLRVDYHRDLPLATRLVRDISGLHFGTFWGHASRATWVVLGLMPGLLFVTGLLMYWNRWLSKRWSVGPTAAQRGVLAAHAVQDAKNADARRPIAEPVVDQVVARRD